MARQIKNLTLGTSNVRVAPALNKDGSLRKNAVLRGNVQLDKQKLEKFIYKIVKKTVEDPTYDPFKPPEPENNNKSKKKNLLKGIAVSFQAVTIAARTITSNSFAYNEAVASTDNVAIKQAEFDRTINGSIAVLSMIPSIYTMIGATILSTAKTLFGNGLRNMNQREGDKDRMRYNFANLDYGKYGTKVYNSERNAWINEDMLKIQKRSLGQKTSV